MFFRDFLINFRGIIIIAATGQGKRPSYQRREKDYEQADTEWVTVIDHSTWVVYPDTERRSQ